MRFQAPALALAAAASASAACIVPQVVFTSLLGPFVLTADSADASIDGLALTVAGSSLAVLDSNVADERNMTLSNGVLALSDAANTTAFVEATGQVGFFEVAPEAGDSGLQLAGRYACSTGETKTHVELYSTAGSGCSCG
ncbi:hypothetical protein EDC01DRAFT_643729 [Geopyxis carbonaria]|nr:hypothetical protein EDC01DRAFT_643729 [Geopyxis carbonaria]